MSKNGTKPKKLIRFDWAMKKILRNKGNFEILEGFLSELLKQDIRIIRILESESNKETVENKFNRVDLLVENAKSELIIIEVQNQREHDYLQRMVYGASKTVVEYLGEGEEYSKIKKIIAVSIVYFDLGQGKDYVYHGATKFVGIHERDVLQLSKKQKVLFSIKSAHKLFPEYYLLRVKSFDDDIKDPLDEWMYFLKHEAVPAKANAKGLRKASQVLDALKMGEKERRAYGRFLESLHDEASYYQSTYVSGSLDGVTMGKASMLLGIFTTKFGTLNRITESKMAKLAESELDKLSKLVFRLNSEQDLIEVLDRPSRTKG